MICGCCCSSRLSCTPHAPSASIASAIVLAGIARRRRCVSVLIMCIALVGISEVEVQPEREIARRSGREVVRLYVAKSRRRRVGVVRLRVRSLILRPDMQVARAEGERCITRIEPFADGLRYVDRRADLAQAPELAVLPVTGGCSLVAQSD